MKRGCHFERLVSLPFLALVFAAACNRESTLTPARIVGTNAQISAAATTSTNKLTPEQDAALRRALTPRPLTRDEVAVAIRSITHSDLPTEATEVFGNSLRVFTEVIDIRFTCSQVALRAFLVASPQLPDDLASETRSLLRLENKLTWWRPKELKNAKGAQHWWKSGADNVSCDLLAGETDESKSVTVYMSFVVETMR